MIVVLAEAGWQPPERWEEAADVAHLEVATTAARASELFAVAESAFVWDHTTALVTQAWTPSSPVRWMHAASVGVDAIASPAIAASPVIVTNTRGVFEPAVAEWVLGALLLLAKRFRETLTEHEAGRWREHRGEMLRDRRLLVVGAGGVGRATAALARAVGMPVTLVGRFARTDDSLGAIEAVDALPRLLPHADAVVLALPLTRETRGIMGAGELSALPRGAWVINVGRGALMDEGALLRAVDEHRIAAALDVFDVEPLPAGHPFWGHPRIFVSPHNSSAVRGWENDAIGIFLENLARFRAGVPLAHVVARELLGAVGPGLSRVRSPSGLCGLP